jgi:hypothetical protein
MFNCLLVIIKGICCVVTVDSKIKAAESTGICLPVKCFIAAKDCYDQCNATVTPENNDVEMAGSQAPSDHVMA